MTYAQGIGASAASDSHAMQQHISSKDHALQNQDEKLKSNNCEGIFGHCSKKHNVF